MGDGLRAEKARGVLKVLTGLRRRFGDRRGGLISTPKSGRSARFRRTMETVKLGARFVPDPRFEEEGRSLFEGVAEREEFAREILEGLVGLQAVGGV